MSRVVLVEHFTVDPDEVSKGDIQTAIEEQFNNPGLAWVDGGGPNAERVLNFPILVLGYQVETSGRSYKVSGSVRYKTGFWACFVIAVLLGVIWLVPLVLGSHLAERNFREKVKNAKTAFPAEAPSRQKGGDTLVALEKLHELKEKGALSEEEFAEQKAKLLS